MNTLSQRDPRWSKILLGYSKTATIGSDGCFITCIAMIIGTTPDVVNQRLKEVNGFVKDTGNLIWDKLPEAFKGITITHLLHAYDNNVVKENLPAFITVDGAPIGAPLHAVVYVGNKLMSDPWTGEIESTSKYRPLKFVILKGEWQQASNNPLKECLSQHATLVSKLASFEQKEKDWIATEERLKDEKDQAIREMEAKVSRLLAEEKVKCQLEYKDKINELTNQILFLVEKYRNDA